MVSHWHLLSASLHPLTLTHLHSICFAAPQDREDNEALSSVPAAPHGHIQLLPDYLFEEPQHGPSFSVGAVVRGLPWTDGGGHTARIYGEGFPYGTVVGQAEEKRLSNGKTALCYQVSRAGHRGITFWPAGLLEQACLALGSSGPGRRQSTAERNAKRKANALTKQTMAALAQKKLGRNIKKRYGNGSANVRRLLEVFGD